MSEELCVLRQITIAPTTGESEGFCASVVVQLIDGPRTAYLSVSDIEAWCRDFKLTDSSALIGRLGAATREGTAQVKLNRLLA